MKVSLQVKSIIAITLICLVIFSLITYFILKQEKETLYNAFREQALVAVQVLSSTLNNLNGFQNENELQDIIYKFIQLNPNIKELNIALKKDEKIKIVASSNLNLIGQEVKNEDYLSYENNQFFETTFFDGGQKFFYLTAPLYANNEKIGICKIKFNLIELEEVLNFSRQRVLIIMIGGIILAMLFFYLFFRKSIINPILKLNKGVNNFSKGNFDFHIKKETSDEIGELADSLNEMAQQLKISYLKLEEIVRERTDELEEARQVLEIKVNARTRELRELNESLEEQVEERTRELKEKIKELERFNKLAVGRELKMIELKKEIEKLKKTKDAKNKNLTNKSGPKINN